MSDKKYSKKHEWVSLEGDVATVGITKHASEMLGDVVFVELPDKGKMLKKKDIINLYLQTKTRTPMLPAITTGHPVSTGREMKNCLMYK